MAKAKAYAESNPALTRAGLAGVGANHSSTVPSTTNDIGAHAQSDDAIQDIPPPQDPNISGMTPTEDTYTWQAGPLTAWQENDDYRCFFEQGDRCVSESATTHRYNTVHDGDYDDNSGHPTALGHDKGHHGAAQDINSEHGTEEGVTEFSLGPVILRRI